MIRNARADCFQRVPIKFRCEAPNRKTTVMLKLVIQRWNNRAVLPSFDSLIKQSLAG